MKLFTLTCLGIILSLHINAQELTKNYYGKNWKGIDTLNTNYKSFYPLIYEQFLYPDKKYFFDRPFWEEGKIRNEVKDSIWNGYYNDSTLFFSELYKKGKLIKGTSYTRKGEATTYKVDYEISHPIGGFNKFYIYTQDYVERIFHVLEKKYPETLLKIEGTEIRILLYFEIKKDGSVNVTKVEGGKVIGFDIKLAQNMFDKYKKWAPTSFKGQYIPMEFRYSLVLHM